MSVVGVSAPVPPTGKESGKFSDQVWIRYYDAYRLYVGWRHDAGGEGVVGQTVTAGVDAVSGVRAASRIGHCDVGAVSVGQSVVCDGAGCVPAGGQRCVRGGLGCVGSRGASSLSCGGEQRAEFQECSEGRSQSFSVDGDLGEASVVGKWHRSNVKKRNRRKYGSTSAQKQLKMLGSWRSVEKEGEGLMSASVPVEGFFSGCDDEVQKDLRNSRAKMFIAQNNLRAEKAKKDLDAMGSVQGIVQQMLDVTSSVAKLQKQTTDEAVHGWARTVASTMAKSITESSSSVPTLESVGFGASGLKSTDGEVLDPARVAAFDRDMKYVEDSFASMDSYSEEDYKLAVHRVKLDFPDVAFTKAQREVAASKVVAVQRLLELGVDYNKIQEAIYPDGE